MAGHITARDPENPSAFWVNPFGMSFSRIRVSDLILVDHDGTLLEGKRPVNNAAFCIHSEVHRARPDACAFFDDHGVYSDYRGVVNDTEEGRRIGLALADGKAVILQNHGLLTVGASVAEAAWYFITMERSCQAQLLAMAAGTPKVIDVETARTVRAQISGALPGWFQFRPLWDQITADQPDLFD